MKNKRNQSKEIAPQIQRGTTARALQNSAAEEDDVAEVKRIVDDITKMMRAGVLVDLRDPDRGAK